MNVLIIQSDGAHKGQDGWTPNWYLRECYAVKYAIEKNGHEADIWGKRHSNFNTTPNFEAYDIIFCIENYEMEWIPDLSKYKPLKLYWAIDLHCQSISTYYDICKNFDIILHSTNSLIPSLKSLLPDKKHLWFPNGIDERYFYNRNMIKTIDVAFVGSKSQSRKNFIEDLEKDVHMKYIFATGSDMINIVSSAKIHFNKNISCDINYRTFETIGLGICLITDDNPELYELGFKDGINCLIYKNYEEAVNKIKDSILSGSWEMISKKAEELSKNHTFTKRIENLMGYL